LALLLIPIQKEDCKTFCPKSRIRINNGQAGAPMMHIQSSSHTASDLCKHISLALLFVSNGISCTISTQSDMCMHTHSSQDIEAGRAKEMKKKLGEE